MLTVQQLIDFSLALLLCKYILKLHTEHQKCESIYVVKPICFDIVLEVLVGTKYMYAKKHISLPHVG